MLQVRLVYRGALDFSMLTEGKCVSDKGSCLFVCLFNFHD